MDHSEGNREDAPEVRSEVSSSQREAKVGQFREDDEMLIGEAAALLGLSPSTVQRKCQEWQDNSDADPRPGIAFVWTRPGTGRLDALGRPIMGRRRLVRASVMAYKRAEDRRRAEVAAELAQLTKEVES